MKVRADARGYCSSGWITLWVPEVRLGLSRAEEKSTHPTEQTYSAPPNCGARGVAVERCTSTGFANLARGLIGVNQRDLGIPRIRSAITLRWIWDVPAAIVYWNDQR